MLQLSLLLVHSLHGQLGAGLLLLGSLHLPSVTSAVRSLLLGTNVSVINAQKLVLHNVLFF